MGCPSRVLCCLASAAVFGSIAVAQSATGSIASPSLMAERPLLKRSVPLSHVASQSVALGDVDGDGDLDLALAKRWPVDQIYLYTNDGRAMFADATSGLPVTPAPTLMTFGDMDGDGDPDLVCGYADSTPNQLLVNEGGGVFRTSPAFLGAQSTAEIELGDVDGDGDLDVVVANRGGELNNLFLNEGRGHFVNASDRFPLHREDTTSAALGDVDGDGDLDVAFGNRTLFVGVLNRLYLNDGSGGFDDGTHLLPPYLDRTNGLVLSDLDGDADLDLLVENDSADMLLRNDGTGAFVAAWRQHVYSGPARCGDVDGDGDQDLVVRRSLLLNDGTGTFTAGTVGRVPPGPPAAGVALGDLDRDGDLDIAHGSFLGFDAILLNDGSGVFFDATAMRIVLGDASARAVAAADLDGDSDLDLIIGNEQQPYLPRRNLVYFNDGSGGFVSRASLPPWTYEDTRALVAVDLDQDGDVDLVEGNGGYYPTPNYIYLNDGSGAFGSWISLSGGRDRTSALASTDVDGDGDPDLVVGNSGANRLYRNDGALTFTEVSAAQLPVDTELTRAVAAGDVDGDGDADLLLANASQLRLYENDGRGFFVDASSARLPATPIAGLSLALGDVDGDGDLDAFVGAVGNRLLLNDGAGGFVDATSQLPADADRSAAVALADLDEDGDLDAIVANEGSSASQNRVYLNDGAATFADATATWLPQEDDDSQALAVGDFDGDGDLDVMFGTGGDAYFPGGRDRLLLDLRRQLSAPTVPTVGRVHTFLLEAAAETTAGHLGAVLLAGAVFPTPVSIPGLGALRLMPPLLALPPVSLPPGTAGANVDLAIPDLASLVGVTLHAQGAVVNLDDPAEVRLTGWLGEVIRG
ncbi:MAG: VCBS repeat-containing protein [Planctomycetota bacterium]